MYIEQQGIVFSHIPYEYIINIMDIHFKDILSPLAVIIGWFMVNHLNKRREQSAEWRKFARSLSSSAELIEKKALEYHKKNTRDRELEEEILFRIDRFEAKYSLLSKNMSVDVFLAARLRAAITLDNFQTDQHTSQSITSSIYGSIKSGTMAIIDDLHNAK